MTFDQIYILAASKEDLANTGMRLMSVDQLRLEGVIPKVKFKEAKSLVQRIRQKKAEEAQRQRRQGKRERRRQAKREMAEARARGEL